MLDYINEKEEKFEIRKGDKLNVRGYGVNFSKFVEKAYFNGCDSEKPHYVIVFSDNVEMSFKSVTRSKDVDYVFYTDTGFSISKI